MTRPQFCVARCLNLVAPQGPHAWLVSYVKRDFARRADARRAARWLRTRSMRHAATDRALHGLYVDECLPASIRRLPRFESRATAKAAR